MLPARQVSDRVSLEGARGNEHLGIESDGSGLSDYRTLSNSKTLLPSRIGDLNRCLSVGGLSVVKLRLPFPRTK